MVSGTHNPRLHNGPFKWLVIVLVTFLALAGRAASAEESRPDVLMIVVDDLNDSIQLLDPQAPIRTPNLQRLAQRGLLFTKAYCASPACNPSRVATVTGLRPTTTGVYGNKSDWRKAMPDRKTIMQHFREGGYHVVGAGKIFHHHLDGSFHDDDSFDEFEPMRPQLYPEKKLNDAPEYGSRNTDWGAWPKREEHSIDHHTATYCAEVLRTYDREQPLFLACGIFKPHSPFFAPPEYHSLNADIPLPRKQPDLNLPPGARQLLKKKGWFWSGMMQLDDRAPGSWHDFVKAYAACVAFADAQIGRVLDALDQSERGKNTIIVLWSDHGFHLGEKNHIEKFALWEKTNHIPLIVVAPGLTEPGSVCTKPVDLTALYPTLLDLCDLPAEPETDGISLRPLLEDPAGDWDRPALMTYMSGNHAVRSERWRYIRYADGSEELYDNNHDPLEWNNLASDPQFAEIIDPHRTWLPDHEAAQVSDLKKWKPTRGQVPK
ncbi:sulfatase [Rubinisphaera margarita]|uniref:sulfatase n=1 Tax=Rubinisphaera margarita TaxID=2909586 RepID=UPI001EE94969|nr:sulfatase [Rubinisphaera margarita]MCG6154385.1 sulfatase [Rubinisphaera margarita]